MKSIPATEELIADMERCIAAMRAYLARIDKERIEWNERFPEHRFTRDNYPPNGSPESGAARRASMDATRALARWRRP